MRVLCLSLMAAVLLMGSSVGVTGGSDEGCVDEQCVLGEFTGQLAFDQMCDGVDVAGVPCMTPSVVEPFSDARLSGAVATTGWSQFIGDTAVLWLGSWLIGDSDEGWVEVTSPRLQWRDGTPTQYTSVLVGTGANEGLSAVAEVTVTGAIFEFDGHIVPGRIEPGVTDYAGVISSGDLADLHW